MTNVPPDDRDAELQRLGATVRELRQARGLTQQQLAEKIGVTRLTVSRFEAGHNDLGSSRLASLAAALGVDPSDFWT